MENLQPTERDTPMNDTSPEMAAKIQALYMQCSGEERMRMCLEMFDFAR